MSANETPDGGRRRPVVALLVVAILFPLAWSVVARVFAQGGRDPDTLPVDPPPGTAACVEEKSTMRFRHMDLLKEMRIDAVRDGNRGAVDPVTGKRTDITFSECARCHASREQFCDRCHRAVNLEPDCFGCHFYPP